MLFSKRIKKSKLGFTLIELLVTLVLIRLFSVMLTLVSSAMDRVFSKKQNYVKAQKLVDQIEQSLKSELKGTRKVKFAVLNSELPAGAGKILDADNLKKDPVTSDLTEYSAVFSSNFVVLQHGIIRSDEVISLTLSDINVLNPSSNIKLIKSPNNHKKVIGFQYKNNPSLHGLIQGQEIKYFTKEQFEENGLINYNDFLNPYGEFKVELFFHPILKELSGGIYDAPGVEVYVNVFESDKRHSVDRPVLQKTIYIELLNLSRPSGTGFKTVDLESYKFNRDNPDRDYRVLYYSKID